jgi:hypothetical protein
MHKAEIPMGGMKDLYGDTLFSEPSAAKAARDEALERVTESGGDWQDRALLMLRRLPPGFEGTGEAFRLRLITDGLDKPHHHNAWGALIRHAIRLGHLQDTGKMAHMRTVRSHARKTPVYVRVAF